jgi:thermostable 8-oxoguanine DNA glycosylase
MITLSPFSVIRNVTCDVLNYQRIARRLQNVGIGCYNHKAKSIISLSWSISKKDLMVAHPGFLSSQIYGWGPKTARYFVLHSRPNQRFAPLDTHILKYLSAHGVPNVPQTTPQSHRIYSKLEEHFLKIFDKQSRYKTLAEFDLAIWNFYSRSKNGKNVNVD